MHYRSDQTTVVEPFISPARHIIQRGRKFSASESYSQFDTSITLLSYHRLMLGSVRRRIFTAFDSGQIVGLSVVAMAGTEKALGCEPGQ